MIRGLNKIIEFSGLGYVMSSYTVHPGGLSEAHTQACHIAGDLMSSGLVVFVPIAYGPTVEPYISSYAEDEDYIKSHEFWMAVDERFWQRCDYGILAMTGNWYKSEGVAAELYALTRGELPIYFLDPTGGHIYTYAEARYKWREEIDALEKLAAEGKHTAVLQEVTEKYPKAVRMALDSKAMSNVFGGKGFGLAFDEDEKEKRSVN